MTTYNIVLSHVVIFHLKSCLFLYYGPNYDYMTIYMIINNDDQKYN
jgi:hypothetical protein